MSEREKAIKEVVNAADCVTTMVYRWRDARVGDAREAMLNAVGACVGLQGAIAALEKTSESPAPAESEEQRRLRVIREFFIACGYDTYWTGGATTEVRVDGLPCPNGRATDTGSHYFEHDWLISKHALRLAAAEAAERGLYIVRGNGLTSVRRFREGAGLGSSICQVVGEDPEQAIVAVTQAIRIRTK